MIQCIRWAKAQPPATTVAEKMERLSISYLSITDYLTSVFFLGSQKNHDQVMLFLSKTVTLTSISNPNYSRLAAVTTSHAETETQHSQTHTLFMREPNKVILSQS